MSSIATVGNSASAWTDLTASRATARKDKLFARADANGDGKVDTSELQTVLDKIASKTGTTAASASDLMASLDTDGSGSLSQDEFSSGMKSLLPAPASTVDFAQQRGGSDDGADSLFASLDSDGSGSLNATELNKLLDQYAALSKEKIGDGWWRNKKRFPVRAAYDLCLKCSHYFNILDARGAISVTERVGVIARVRALAVGIAKAWMDQQYPSEKKTDSDSAAKSRAQEKKGKLQPVG